MYLAIKNQMFNRHSMLLSVRKIFRLMVQRLPQTNAKTGWLSEYKGGSLLHSQNRQLSPQEEVGGIDGIKTV